MKYEKNFKVVKDSMKKNITNALEEIGAFCTAESQARTPVDSGRLRREQGYQVQHGNQVDIGTNVEYSIDVHEGNSRQRPQPFLKDAIMQNIGEITNIAKRNIEK